MSNRKLIIAGAVLACASHPVEADKVFAHSKSLNMSFTALGEPWCAEKVDMRVTAADPAKFGTADYSTIIQKLGQVLTRECAEASALAITGVTGEQTVWTGSAAKADGWVAQQTTAATAASATESAPAESTANATEAPVEQAAATAAAPATKPAPAESTASVTEAPVEQTAVAVPPVSEPAAPVKAQEQAPAAKQAASTETSPVPAEAAVAVDMAPQVQAMEIAGWKPGNPAKISGVASRMTQIASQDDGCKIRTFGDIKLEYHPSFKMRGKYDCVDGYVQSSDRKRQSQAQLFYEGQKQAFQSVSGYWLAGYNLHSGFPSQIVAIYDQVQQQARYGNRNQTMARMLVWLGEDRDLRTHYFATYNSTGAQWVPDRNLVIVVTDNDELKNNPEKAALAKSLAEVYKDFHGYRSIDQLSSVPFVITDKMHDMPAQTYQQVMRDSNPDASFYKAGRATRQRGMPWMIQVQTDFVAKRKAFEVAEQQRIEAEKARLAQLRARHQASLDQQYQQLSSAGNYDRVRFYATLMLEKERMRGYKIDFTSNRAYSVSPLSAAINLSHPAQYLNLVNDGRAALGGPMYMLVQANDGEIEKPYPMVVERNDAADELDDWMLVKVGPEFGFGFDDGGKPVFNITVQDAIACKSDKCLSEMDATTMMKTWYDDDDMEFAVAARQ